MRIEVLHVGYGCESGCCGHVIEVDGEPISSSFDFDHPASDPVKLRKYVLEHVPPECHASLDWSTLTVPPQCW